ncbi:MAG: hypothetical protein R3A49_02610 [Acidimicrobiia bacterium]
MTDLSDLIAQLQSIEEQLRDLAFDRLRDRADGVDGAKEDEKRLEQARRAVARALKALGSEPDPFS